MYTVPLSFIGGVGGTELVVVFVVILVLFGPKRLPEIARMIGRTLDELRNASQDFKDQVMKIDDDVPNVSDSGEDTYKGDYGESDGMEDSDTYDYDNPYGEVVGARLIYQDQPNTVAKGLIKINNGDKIDFLCDYYTYDEEYDERPRWH